MTCLSSSSIFTAIEDHFATLTSSLREPLTVALNEGKADDPRRLTLPEARSITRDPAAPPEDRDAIWRELVYRARRKPEPWRLAAVWVMLPGLRAAAHRIAQSTRLEIADIRSALIAGFFEALNTIEPRRENLGSALNRSAYNAARTACRVYGRELPTEDIDHAANSDDVPDIPVHRSVVATTQGATPTRGRLEGERLGSIAHRAGIADRLCPPARCRMRTLRPTVHDAHRRSITLRVCANPGGKLTAAPARVTDAIKERP